jgi:aminopeptidase N
MALHMMRLMMGDELFFGGVRRFYLSSRFRKVGSEDFRYAMEEESGIDLRRFFERWIYNATLPQVTFTHRLDGDGKVVLRFEQGGDIFDFPALVTLTFADGKSRDVTVPVNDRVVEFPVRLDGGTLRAASISRRDVGLVEYR